MTAPKIDAPAPQVAASDPAATRSTIAAAFIGCVVGANWALGRYGVVAVGFGLAAPAGVYFAGLSFGLRDALHEAGGKRWVVTCIVVGAATSYAVEEALTVPGGRTSIALASGVAFLVSELADLVVYTPLRSRNWPAAVVASNIVGGVFDSALFLWLAFGSVDHIIGQVVGKSYMVAAAFPVVYLVRRRAVSRHTLNRTSA